MLTDKKNLPVYHVFLPEDLSKEAFIHWTDNSGKRHRLKGGINRFHTLEERKAAAYLLIKQISVRVDLSDVKTRMIGWVEDMKGVWRPKTFRNEMTRLRMFLDFCGKKRINNALVRSFFVHLQNSRHACTYHHYRRFLKSVFTGIGMPEMMDSVERRKYISTPAKYFQRVQIARIKNHLLANDPMLWLACEFIYYCFIRPGELRMLKIGDIHFDEFKICMRSDISKNKKQQFVTIPEAFRPSLEQLKHRTPREFVFYKEDCTKPLPVNGMVTRFRKVLRELGFGTEYQLYSWKHTGAVAAVRAGASLKELQIQLRHHSLEEVDKYIRQLGVNDLQDLEGRFPAI